MKRVKLDYSQEITIADEAFDQISAIAEANRVCEGCDQPYTPDNPMVVLNRCVRCFLKYHANQGYTYIKQYEVNQRGEGPYVSGDTCLANRCARDCLRGARRRTGGRRRGGGVEIVETRRQPDPPLQGDGAEEEGDAKARPEPGAPVAGMWPTGGSLRRSRGVAARPLGAHRPASRTIAVVRCQFGYRGERLHSERCRTRCRMRAGRRRLRGRRRASLVSIPPSNYW